ncbi:MAG: NADH-quinone oxidoreductase subunit C [Acidobacteria bacterium]|nr:NADH-quinone oxidoreductase subunit C [Acidobacteriota bacterium]
MDVQPLIDQLAALVPGVELSPSPSADSDVTPALWVSATHIRAVCQALRDTPGLEFLAFSNVTAVDHHPSRTPRFDVVYHLVSPHRRTRLRLKVQLGLDEPIASVTPVWEGAGWCEREVYDLFGIVFEGHADLRRLMMTEDWVGHPLRKDYPVQVRKDAQAYMPLQITAEEFRASMERDRYTRTRPK